MVSQDSIKEIYFKEEAREKLFNGINKLYDAVSSTLGPNGKTVIITGEKGEPIVTKDGVSVSAAVSFKDPIENMGATMIKAVATKTADLAGDGTTTATVLATAFINNLKDFNPNEVTKAFEDIIPKVIDSLKANSKQLKKSDIKYVASISANNDMEIGNVIQDAYNFSSIVKVEPSNHEKDELILLDGTQLDVSYFSKHFITNPSKAECELSEPNVIIIDGRLSSLQCLETPIKHVSSNDESILIIVEEVSDQVLRLLETNVISGNLKCCVIKTPGFGSFRKDLLRDLADLTGSTVINNLAGRYDTRIMGKLKSVKVSKNSSILIKHEDVDISDLVLSLDELRKSKDLEGHDYDLINRRYENLASKVSIIKVGGGSYVEMKERYDRYDDAVKASACALEEGIVEGGGIALYRADTDVYPTIKNLIEEAILNSILEPSEIIFKLSEMTDDKVIGNMFDKNIIDPLKVTRTALENAASVAKTILTTNCVVLNEYQWS